MVHKKAEISIVGLSLGQNIPSYQITEDKNCTIPVHLSRNVRPQNKIRRYFKRRSRKYAFAEANTGKPVLGMSLRLDKTENIIIKAHDMLKYQFLKSPFFQVLWGCLLYTSDAADE